MNLGIFGQLIAGAAGINGSSNNSSAGITFVQAYGSVASAQDPLTVSNVVVPAGAIIIVFAAVMGGIETITSVKFNTTETLTAIQTLVDNSGGVGIKNSAWILHNPTATTANVVVDWSATPIGYSAVHVLVYNGVKTDAGAAGAYRALATPDGSAGTGANITVAATSGDWIVGNCGSYDIGNNAVLSALSHTNRRTDTPIDSNLYDYSTQDSNGTVGGSTDLTWTNDEFCTNIGFALIPQ